MTTTWTGRATDYARAVVRGDIVSGRWARLACERHLRDLERQGTEGFPQHKGRRIARRALGKVSGRLDPLQRKPLTRRTVVR